MKKQRWEESEKRREKNIKEEKTSEEKNARARKGRNVVKHFVLPMFWGSGGSESRLERCVRNHLARWQMKNCTLLRRKANLEINKLKTAHIRNPFGSWNCWKHARRYTVYGVVARNNLEFKSTSHKPWASGHFWKLNCWKKYAIVVRNACRCQNCQKLSGSEHFWKLRLRWWKSVRRGGAKDW